MSRRHDTANKVFTATGVETYDVRGYSDALVVLTEDGDWTAIIQGAITESGTYLELYRKYGTTVTGTITASDLIQLDLRGVGFLKFTIAKASGASMTVDLGLYEE